MVESTLAQSALDFQSLENAFIDAALTDLRRAEETLAAHPEIARAGFYTALVLGDVDRVRQALDETPALAVTKGGPRQWEPLLYVCFSLFANGKSRPRRLSHRNCARASAPRRRSQHFLHGRSVAGQPAFRPLRRYRP
jgi:hypothetical protein